MLGAIPTPFAEHPGACYTCSYFGRETNPDEVWCAKPDHEHVCSQAQNGCTFWQREPGANFEPPLLLRIDGPYAR